MGRRLVLRLVVSFLLRRGGLACRPVRARGLVRLIRWSWSWSWTGSSRRAKGRAAAGTGCIRTVVAIAAAIL